jgi:hypothetical protein
MEEKDFPAENGRSWGTGFPPNLPTQALCLGTMHWGRGSQCTSEHTPPAPTSGEGPPEQNLRVGSIGKDWIWYACPGQETSRKDQKRQEARQGTARVIYSNSMSHARTGLAFLGLHSRCGQLSGWDNTDPAAQDCPPRRTTGAACGGVCTVRWASMPNACPSSQDSLKCPLCWESFPQARL